ncbi:TPA: ead/Ea22-like family protein [Klebsiella pneumoniae]|nr:ead/Ea22-like family protein [Klebsiella pneumoniae]HBQ7862706.1 ead/Ea22-like family protein [Klebsiella pneumoniae]HBQ7873791.1 ead/Ea22-like family protein [Klebsiella pneumoniae]HBQ7879608.1 ead/Ea22-like family protein [Klebsiella pneumoniae]HBQ7890738.1 ead/Ea22-like family protein [Klebsiella pneumoniae]
MTDITELAQSLKAAAPNVTSGPWVVKDYFWLTPESEVFSGEFVECHNGPDAQYLKLLSPENILALLEALEKAQQHIARQEQILLNQDESLSICRGELEAAHQRIAELESRTVKLTDINEYLAEVHDKTLNRAFRLLAEGVRAGDVAAMRAAGIKVEAE